MRRLFWLLAVVAGVPAPFLEQAARAKEISSDEKLVLYSCGRCHVVGERNRMGGIGSTPSFRVIRTWEDWEDKMSAFWTLRPHPAFTQIEGLTEPFPEDLPSPIHPIRLTREQVDRIVDYARKLEPADLGPDLGVR